MTEREEQQQIAQTILAQLGGNRFVAMTGASSFSSWHATGNIRGGLTFRIPQTNKIRARSVQIYLMDTDTYRVQFATMKKYDFVILATHDDVYADNLRTIFESVTGLYTSL